jgi:ADP-heptose:LPS heptosyltransferase
VAGETDLCQLGALIARADLFVGTDSGPRHVAGAVRCPQVTVMSSLDDPWRWGLDRPSEVILRTDPSCHGCMLSECSHRLCLDLISADRVIAACQELLTPARRSGMPRLTISV